MRKIALALILAAAPLSAQSTEKTPASAFAFIQSSMGDGSWKGTGFDCDDLNDENTCSVETYPIVSVSASAGDICRLIFTMKTDVRPFRISREINLRQNFTFLEGSTEIIFQGPIRATDGKIIERWDAISPSWDMRERVVSALKFLQAACKPASPW